VRLACFAHQFVMGGMAFSDFVSAAAAGGVEALEIGVANLTATPGHEVDRLRNESANRDLLLREVESAGIEIGALNCFGNPLHPDPDRALGDRTGIEDTIRLAADLGVSCVVTASGCPGDTRWPIWITWPLYWEEIADSQWEIAERAWVPLGQLAADLGVDICLELHPGQLVYNTSTFERLRDLAGPAIKANLDPAHLFYQGMDPLVVASRLGTSLGHVHAKDTVMDIRKVEVDGFLDTTPLNRVDRAWRYVAVGDGHDIAWWTEFLDTLRQVNYQGLVSIEHEDAALEGPEALRRNVAALRAAGLVASSLALHRAE
jgi:sugar phosphate isomerase/epimerase